MHFEEQNARYRALIEDYLKKTMEAGDIPALLLKSMEYSLMAGGKRLRPCLCFAGCAMAGGDPKDALPLAAGLEMIHSYSLIHDDLPCMDNDDFRRGKPTNHRVFGEGHAVLAGDGLLSYAFEWMLEGARARNYAPGYMEGLLHIAKGAGVRGMVAGQSADLLNEKEERGDEETLRYIHSRKTGALIKASLLSGASCANMEREKFMALEAFSEAYGLLFQITDDILDVEGELGLLGKSIGKDAAENKLTYVRLYGLEGAKAIAKETAETALSALSVFGAEGDYLRTLTKNTMGRKH